METIKRYDKEIEINGHSVLVGVFIAWAWETEPVEGSFCFGDEQENAEYLARFKSGELANVCLRVTAYAEGCEGVDHLGMCHISTENFEDEILKAVTDQGMEGEAVAYLTIEILNQAKRLKKYAV